MEGNIGCGKTTLLNYFEAFQNCEVLVQIDVFACKVRRKIKSSMRHF